MQIIVTLRIFPVSRVVSEMFCAPFVLVMFALFNLVIIDSAVK